MDNLLSNLPVNVYPILVSAGNREIWKEVLSTRGLLRHDNKIAMGIVAGNHSTRHLFMVDDTAKAFVVSHLRKQYSGCWIISFGDSGKILYLDTGLVHVKNKELLELILLGYFSVQRLILLFLFLIVKYSTKYICGIILSGRCIDAFII